MFERFNNELLTRILSIPKEIVNPESNLLTKPLCDIKRIKYFEIENKIM